MSIKLSKLSRDQIKLLVINIKYYVTDIYLMKIPEDIVTHSDCFILLKGDTNSYVK